MIIKIDLGANSLYGGILFYLLSFINGLWIMVLYIKGYFMKVKVIFKIRRDFNPELPYLCTPKLL